MKAAAASKHSESTQPEEIAASPDFLDFYVPAELRDMENPQTAIPAVAKNARLLQLISTAVQRVPTAHDIYLGDARARMCLPENSVHLILTSPPYWTLKQYRDSPHQMGHIRDYEAFLIELDKVWSHCYRALVPGGRLICVVGDVCLSRRRNAGRHTVVPLHASIQEHCRKLGYDNLAPIIWYKIANAAYEVDGGSGFLGKPYEPNSVIKNDIEFILMERKPGGYRTPSIAKRVLSVLSAGDHNAWFQQVWSGLAGASTKEHPAPFPLALAERLIRMFSFVGDTVVDPFLGTGTTAVAAAKWGRNSLGYETDEHYHQLAVKRIRRDTSSLFSKTTIRVPKSAQDAHSA